MHQNSTINIFKLSGLFTSCNRHVELEIPKDTLLVWYQRQTLKLPLFGLFRKLSLSHTHGCDSALQAIICQGHCYAVFILSPSSSSLKSICSLSSKRFNSVISTGNLLDINECYDSIVQECPNEIAFLTWDQIENLVNQHSHVIIGQMWLTQKAVKIVVRSHIFCLQILNAIWPCHCETFNPDAFPLQIAEKRLTVSQVLNHFVSLMPSAVFPASEIGRQAASCQLSFKLSAWSIFKLKIRYQP